MKSIPSVEFRKTYQRLEETVRVTALGRVIGTWIPTGAVKLTMEAGAATDVAETWQPIAPAYSTRPFTPVPKKGK